MANNSVTQRTLPADEMHDFRRNDPPSIGILSRTARLAASPKRDAYHAPVLSGWPFQHVTRDRRRGRPGLLERQDSPRQPDRRGAPGHDGRHRTRYAVGHRVGTGRSDMGE